MDVVVESSAAAGRGRRHLADVGLAAALAVLLLPATVRAVRGSSWPTALEVAGIAAVVLAHSSVALRRTAPRSAFAAVGGFVVFLVLTPPLGQGSDLSPFSAVLVPSVLVFPVVLYSVAAWCPDRTSRLALVLSIAGGFLVLVRLWGADYLTVAQPGLARDDDPVRSWPLFLLMGVVPMVVLPWWGGRYRRLRLLYVAELEERARREEDERAAEARRAVESERRRIALEMHDVVAHSLSVMVSQAEGGRMMAAKDPAASVPVLETIARAGREAMHDMGSVLRVLDPPDDAVSSPGPPQPGVAELPALLEDVRRSGLPVTFEEHGARQPLSSAAGLTVYRVTQEAMTNVLRHSPGMPAEVTLTWRDGVVEVCVANRTHDRPRSSGGSGRGLRGMEQRLLALGGSLRVATGADRFTVVAHIPTATEPAP